MKTLLKILFLVFSILLLFTTCETDDHCCEDFKNPCVSWWENNDWHPSGINNVVFYKKNFDTLEYFDFANTFNEFNKSYIIARTSYTNKGVVIPTKTSIQISFNIEFTNYPTPLFNGAIAFDFSIFLKDSTSKVSFYGILGSDTSNYQISNTALKINFSKYEEVFGKIEGTFEGLFVNTKYVADTINIRFTFSADHVCDFKQ